MNPKFYNRFKGFSVAEAMVTLLIVSIALSAIAPIFSKRNAATLNTQSKWEKTTNGNITRVSGNVGIGLANTVEPDSKLHVVDTDANKYRFGSNDAFFSIKGTGDTTIFEISKTGGITFQLPGGNTIALFKNTSGTEVAKINSDGSASFGVPAGAIIFVNGDCPSEGWTDVSSNYAGAFIQVGSTVNTTSTAANIVTNPKQVVTECSGVGVSCTKDSVNEVGTAAEGADLLQPKYITLKACQKNAYTTPAGG